MILVIDDDASIRETLALTLESHDYSVLTASNAQEAIQQLIHHATDITVVILDMGMPPHEHTPEEGLKVLDKITEAALACKVIVLTGQEAETTAYQAIKHGAFDFLSKPITADQLLAAVKRAELFYQQTQKLKQQEGIQKVALDLPLGEGVKSARNQAEYKLLKQVLNDTQFNVHEAARRLNLKRENVYYLIKKYHIQREEE
ncbi:response regulator [Galenea microaerophila]